MSVMAQCNDSLLTAPGLAERIMNAGAAVRPHKASLPRYCKRLNADSGVVSCRDAGVSFNCRWHCSYTPNSKSGSCLDSWLQQSKHGARQLEGAQSGVPNAGWQDGHTYMHQDRMGWKVSLLSSQSTSQPHVYTQWGCHAQQEEEEEEEEEEEKEEEDLASWSFQECPPVCSQHRSSHLMGAATVVQPHLPRNASVHLLLLGSSPLSTGTQHTAKLQAAPIHMSDPKATLPVLTQVVMLCRLPEMHMLQISPCAASCPQALGT